MCNRLNMDIQAYERFCEFFLKKVSVTKFGLPKNGQIDDCNITFFGGNSHLHVGNRQFTMKFEVVANISSCICSKHRACFLVSFCIDFSVVTQHFGLILV